MSLCIGEEFFDITEKDITKQNAHVFASVGDGLLCRSLFKKKLGFRPVSLDSVTHKKLTKSVNDRFKKKARIRTFETDVDPEKLKEMQVKRAEEKIRANAKRENQQRRLMEASHRQPLSARYLEGDDYDEDDNDGYEQSLNAIKEMSGYSRKRGKKTYADSSKTRSSYFQDDAEEEESEQKILDAKNFDMDDDFDVEDDESVPAAKKRKGGAVFDSESD